MGSPKFYLIVCTIFDRHSAYLQNSEKPQIVHDWYILKILPMTILLVKVHVQMTEDSKVIFKNALYLVC